MSTGTHDRTALHAASCLPLGELGARLFTAAADEETSLLGFWARHRLDVAEVHAPIDRALLGGAIADRVAWAFLSGYQAALCALVPSRDPAQLAALCVTESGGGHPRAVLSELRALSGADTLSGGQTGRGHTLTGHKRWSTTVPDVDVLLVVARQGADVDGHPQLRVAMLEATRAGVRFSPMPPPPFVPELSHGEVVLDGVHVADDELLPGDGYARYVKPFRTIEDLHVNAAVLAYLLGAARRHHAPQSLVERLFAAIVAVRALAVEDARAAATHLALAGLLAIMRPLVDELVAHLATRSDDAAALEHTRLTRDLALLGIAGKAREQRRANAWATLATDPSAGPAVAAPAAER